MTDTKKLVEYLRELDYSDGVREAADEIEKLQKRVKELEYEIELMWQDAAGASL